MSLATINGVLGVDLPTVSGNLVVNYPAGTSRGDFLLGVNNSVIIGQNAYKAPGRCTFTFNAANISINNKSGTTWPKDAPYIVQADMPGAGGSLSDNGLPMPRVIPWEDRFLDLGSPLALSAAGLRAAAAVAAAGALVLLQTYLDVPRNITIASSGVDTARVFTITSKDEYGRTVVETITGVNAATVAGKKAHKSAITISADAACVGNISVGWGNVLGLPVFVSSAVFVSKELQDGAAAAAGTFVYGDVTQPSATTGDVRGTYVPNAAPDGNKGYGIFITTPDPGYLGADQFAG